VAIFESGHRTSVGYPRQPAKAPEAVEIQGLGVGLNCGAWWQGVEARSPALKRLNFGCLASLRQF